MKSILRPRCFLNERLKSLEPHPRWDRFAPLAIERGPRLTEKLIRRTLGKDREHSAKLRSQIGYAATARDARQTFPWSGGAQSHSWKSQIPQGLAFCARLFALARRSFGCVV
jgi:hypothetical protein